jgi:hypothetical protein
LLLLGCFAARCASPQSAAPSTAPAAPGVVTAAAGVTTGKTTDSATGAAKKPDVIATPASFAGSPHLIAKTGPPEDEVNRKSLEETAGKDAASLLMRSTPTGAQIFINGAYVGRAPVLLSVAPGKYKIEMRGEHDDSAERTIGLLPRDTQKISMILGTRYPNRISIQ